MSPDENKALIRRMFDEFYNRANLDLADELFSDDYANWSGTQRAVLGPDGMKAIIRSQHAAFPDQVTAIDDVIAEGDKVVVRGTDTGTHTGTAFANIPTSGKAFSITWIYIFRIENGKIAESWLELDADVFWRQLRTDDLKSS